MAVPKLLKLIGLLLSYASPILRRRPSSNAQQELLLRSQDYLT